MPNPLPTHIIITIVLGALCAVTACGPTRNEGWNSYYYGTGRESSVNYNAQDNDDTYKIPWGTYADDQMPQGQKW